MNTDLTRSIEQATTIDELVRQFEALLAVDISDTPKGHQRLKANQLAKDILAKYNGDYSNVSPEDKAALRDYTGFGGIGGRRSPTCRGREARQLAAQKLPTHQRQTVCPRKPNQNL
ncbi:MULTISPECIES: hypothetical protein [Vibrio]|uniref:hypothetical protein n=1 Tax=Vibrio TaxID=662 RepID=UPI001CDB89C4|nr:MULTISPECIES: hypothetical protein [Vibrio]MCA2440530.1 hypothetical protein [Vibrio alginolyticus]MDW1933126.1 hypothetical protein [Vibrio sp. 970]MDW1961239.1 hypothetical protein [Vibrio sp. 661]